MANIPTDRFYLPSHEWHKAEGDLVVVGVSQIAVDELTDVTYVDVKTKSGKIEAGKVFGDIESVKATSELYCGVSGEVVAVNAAVIADPSLVNADCYEKAWIIKVKPASADWQKNLLDGAAYKAKAAH
jgi:glycine cleavage system H protein